jgi:hypothetical protein
MQVVALPLVKHQMELRVQEMVGRLLVQDLLLQLPIVVVVEMVVTHLLELQELVELLL